MTSLHYPRLSERILPRMYSKAPVTPKPVTSKLLISSLGEGSLASPVKKRSVATATSASPALQNALSESPEEMFIFLVFHEIE
ncbi:hypothetical protein MMG85_06170 [Pseudoxanthomonas sp. LH2527]|uniref:hypothetical protein n=1 Tax=Pseudoxanthomonas sp. LH2527 TaxID=2923249 RepID=UPI001F131869|nr:hypothetical protein [Pseudoxanthomonas sp. LH2527]MCH6483148.1 hypothetical protein [Pseudoxanthomonas sp. LH2527]